MTASTLLPILCVLLNITTTSCSKVPQGLRFPLEVCGIFTTQYFRKDLVRDSDNLVKPFMHVAIQTTRHYAHNFLVLALCLHKDRTISSQLILMSKNNFLLI